MNWTVDWAKENNPAGGLYVLRDEAGQRIADLGDTKADWDRGLLIIAAVANVTGDGPLDFASLALLNAQRCERWHAGWREDGHSWSGADWSNAMAGEAGEAANVVKKLRRDQLGFKGARDPGREALRTALADELGDLVTYADLLATYYGLDLGECVRQKFNRVSEREEFPERL